LTDSKKPFIATSHIVSATKSPCSAFLIAEQQLHFNMGSTTYSIILAQAHSKPMSGTQRAGTSREV
ncbi:hypothetical protein Moror_15537, partial [Moniliophthora roreri MCA 2997]